MKSPRTILVRAPNWIGDQVLAYPFFYYLRRAYPKARIASVCVQWVEDLQFKDLVDQVFRLKRPGTGKLTEKLSLLESAAREIRAQGPWDLAISLPNSLSSAWLLFRSGARIRRGYKVEARGLLFNQALEWDPSPSRHRAQAYVDLLPDEAKPAGEIRSFFGIPPENDLDPGIPGELEFFPIAESWPSVERITPPQEPYWVLAPGATAESRRWPISYFVSLARKVRAETGWKGIVIGGPKEAPIAAQLCQDHSLGLRDCTAQCPVPGLAPLFAGARFTVTNESGLAHVAALCGSFVQIVCGAADPKRTTPLGPGRVQVAFNPVECWPCERNTCDQPFGKKLQCLNGIEPDAVWEEIKRGIRLR